MHLYVQLTTSMVAIGYFYHFIVSPLQDGDTPLDLARKNGHSAVVSLLEKSDNISKLRVHFFIVILYKRIISVLIILLRITYFTSLFIS